jgi:hypothetical protein
MIQYATNLGVLSMAHLCDHLKEHPHEICMSEQEGFGGVIVGFV